jgi:hypothetical protein
MPGVLDREENQLKGVREFRDKLLSIRALGDGAYDSRANFNFLDGRRINPVIRVRSNSVLKGKGSQARKKAVTEQQVFKPKAWSNIHRFGYRRRVEGVFHIKRIFGEYVTAKFMNMVKEMVMKASIYNRFIAMV